MTVSEKDRDYMRRLGKFMDEVNAEELAEHLARPIEERVDESERHYRRGLGWARPSKTPKELAALYERAHRLGLYRP
jgi:hypothetical protein